MRTLRRFLAALTLVSLFALSPPAPAAGAVTVTVTMTQDTDNPCFVTGTGACSLRDAVRYGNAHAGTQITVPAGQFTLRDRDPSKADEQTGDLDIKADMTISGAGAAQTIIDANRRDRVLEVYGAASGQPLSNVLIRGVTFTGGTEGYDSGAGIRNKGNLHLIGCNVIFNLLDPTQAAGGKLVGAGGISNAGILQVDGGVIEGNMSGNDLNEIQATAGGIGNDPGATATINNAIIRNNSSPERTGGIGNLGGVLTINASTIVGNSSGIVGGILSEPSNGPPKSAATLTITNSTISGNIGILAGGIGVLDIATLTHLTIAGNSSGLVGANLSTVMIANSIISNSTGGSNCGGAIVSQGYNLDSGASCGFVAGGTDLSGADPMLALLADNGGGTLTHALLPGSPAIDAIPVSACPINHDQRGKDRPSPPGGKCDIGAVEQAGTTTTLVSSANPAAVGQSVTFTATVAGANGAPTGTVIFADRGVSLGPAVALAGGMATFTTASLTADNHVITATYSGDSTFTGSASAPLLQVVGSGGGGGATGGLQFFPLAAPIRLLDTRPGGAAFKTPDAPLTAGQSFSLPGRFTYQGVAIPAAAIALVGNATVDNAARPVPAGFATLYPSGGTLPLASNLNFVPGTVRPNAFTVALGPDGAFNLYSSTGGNFIVDITGYYAPPAAGGLFFHPLAAPVRLLDTRAGGTAFKAPGAALTAGQTLALPGRFVYQGATIPASATALAGNATVDNSAAPVAAGFATLYPGGASLPLASNLNFVPGTVAPNAFTVGLGGDGSFNLFSNTGGNFILDITGYYDTNVAGGLGFVPLSAPVRELDTRAGQAAFAHPGVPVGAKGTVTLPGSFTFNGVTVPNTAKAVVGNATVDNTINAPDGFATLFPGGTTLPLASNLNYSAGTVAPNAFIVGIGADGTFNLYSLSGGNFILDITGYFTAAPGGAAKPTTLPPHP